MALVVLSDFPPSPEPPVEDRHVTRSFANAVQSLEAAPHSEVGAQPAPSGRPHDNAALPLRLIGLHGELDGREWWFAKAFLVGRIAASGLVLNNMDVSQKHAHFWRTDAGWWVADLGSTNGTYVNGNRIGLAPVGPLTPGTVVQFGNLPVRVGEVARPLLVGGPDPHVVVVGHRDDS